MARRISPRTWSGLGVLFGAVTAYCFYGALHQRLFIPNRHTSGGAIYSGASAWLIFGSMAAFSLICCSNAFARPSISDGKKVAVSLTLMIMALGMLAAAEYYR